MRIYENAIFSRICPQTYCNRSCLPTESEPTNFQLPLGLLDLKLHDLVDHMQNLLSIFGVTFCFGRTRHFTHRSNGFQWNLMEHPQKLLEGLKL